MKEQKDLVGLSRIPIVNQYHAIKQIERSPTNRLIDLITKNKLVWFFKSLPALLRKNHPYKTYSDLSPNNGVFTMDNGIENEVNIALLSDWASDTQESHDIAHMVGDVDYSIHLGDTYYIGNCEEIKDNFDREIGTWPYGRFGSFAMLGNHEMYSGGEYYFTNLLGNMGVWGNFGHDKQEASIFCLENDYWRIIGLDTGYDSLGLLNLLPKYKLKLNDYQVDWLKNTVDLKNDKRGIILLSHHQYLSAFDDEYQEFGKQIAEIIGPGKSILWFWGHEHRLAIYGKNQLPDGPVFFARCIGNSGMPVEVDKKVQRVDRNLVLYDARVRNNLGDGVSIGFNGYVGLKLKEENLVVNYYDDGNLPGMGGRLILTESWSVDNSSGQLKGININHVPLNQNDKLSEFPDSTNLFRAIQ